MEIGTGKPSEGDSWVDQEILTVRFAHHLLAR